MPANRDKKTKKWNVSFYATDWQGNKKKVFKRGFATKKEALEYERNYLTKESSSGDIKFGDFVDKYMEDMSKRLKQNTFETKKEIIKNHIRPYFEKKKLKEITASDIRKWQQEIMGKENKRGQLYSPSYLRTVHAQMSALFNYACKFYSLSINPANVAGSMGSEPATEMKIWTVDEYKRFADVAKDKNGVFEIFEILFWGGLRLGEALALTPEAFDFGNHTVYIFQSLQRIHGETIITTPKTKHSVRKIVLPTEVSDEIQDYCSRIYELKPTDLIFPFSKSMLHHEMERCAKTANVPKIRIHDLRHSHVSLLISIGFSAKAIANRMGHESIRMTYKYAHLLPGEDQEIADRLEEFKEDNNKERVKK